MIVATRPCRLLAMLLLMLLPACSWISSFGSVSEQRYEALLAEHNYRELDTLLREREQDLRADEDMVTNAETATSTETVTNAETATNAETVNNQTMTDKDRQRVLELAQIAERRAIVKSRASHYQQEKLAAIRTHMAAGEWSQASTTLDFLQANMLPNDTLQTFADIYHNKRSAYLEELERRIVLIEARSLPSALPLYQQWRDADDQNEWLARRLQQQQGHRERLVAALDSYVDCASNNQDYPLALKYLKLAQGLQASESRAAQLRDLQGRMAQRRSDRAKAPMAAERREQMATYADTLARHDWLAARKLLASMRRESPNEPILTGLQAELDEKIDVLVVEAREEGEKLYSAGEIEQALSVWAGALQLRPEDTELASNIERAQRILNKVKSLQDATSAPAVAAPAADIP
mgnify:CR=1 FL=1